MDDCRHHAEKGLRGGARLSFGEVAALYDRARPSYPPALVDHLVGLLAPGPDNRVLDVGCGTAKAAVLLAKRGMAGAGVEPDPEMAAVARANLAPFPNWSVADADFEDYQGGPGGGFDLLVSGQAWHWLDPDRRFETARRLMRPAGWLALFWNRTGPDGTVLRREVDAVYAELAPTLSVHGALTCGRPPVGTPPAGFGPPAWHVFPWVERYTAAGWTDLVQTHSDHRRLAAADRRALLERLAAVIDGHGGVYDHPYECWLWTARRMG